MLNKELVLKELNSIVVPEFNQWLEEYNLAIKLWNKIESDKILQDKIKETQINFVIPEYFDNLQNKLTFKPYKDPYRLIAIDGSQIYPDRHSGVPYYLINIGIVDIAYRTSKYSVNLSSVPYIFNSNSRLRQGFAGSEEIVNCQRTELELETGFKIAYKAKGENNSLPVVSLCDGSLIFWHLESKDKFVQEKYLKNYLKILDDYYKAEIPIIGYISLPKSRELVNIIKTGIVKNFFDLENINLDLANNLNSIFEGIIDTDILSSSLINSLNTFSSTIIFKNRSNITKYYPKHLTPHFIYINLNSEIVRLEFPEWLIQNFNLLKLSIEIIIDQVIKGHGYPVTLAESHEQAVIKNSDREFFYYLINKTSNKNSNIVKAKRSISNKSLNKKLVKY